MMSADRNTILYDAVQVGDIEVLKFLLEKNPIVDFCDSDGAQPIHIAAQHGHLEIVKLFLRHGISSAVVDYSNKTLLHYAVESNNLDLCKYLVKDCGIPTNCRDISEVIPLHISCKQNTTSIAALLLNNESWFDSVNDQNKTPLQITKDENLKSALLYTEKLFDAVKINNLIKVKLCIARGAFVNSKTKANYTPLYFASWKGYAKIVETLLKSNADPNTKGDKNCTPLHYAAKYGHFDVVLLLLSYGAIYNAKTYSSATPSDFTNKVVIKSFLRLIDQCFTHVRNGNVRVLRELNKVKDLQKMRAIMSAKNTDKQCLIVNAMLNNFPKVDELKVVLQDGFEHALDLVDEYLLLEQVEDAIFLLGRLIGTREEIFGNTNPSTLDVFEKMAFVLQSLQRYPDALDLNNKILESQINNLGENSKEALNTQSRIAIIMHQLEYRSEALTAYEKILAKQKEILGPTHLDVLTSQFHMGVVLDTFFDQDQKTLGLYRDSLEKHITVHEGKYKNAIHGIQNNIAFILAKQGKHEEAITMYKKVYKGRKVELGKNHSITLRVLHDMATVYVDAERNDEAVKAYTEVLELQKNALGPKRFNTVVIMTKLGGLYKRLGKPDMALKYYKLAREPQKKFLEPTHPFCIGLDKQVHDLELGILRSPQDEQKRIEADLFKAVIACDEKWVQAILYQGINANITDADGISPLQFAVNSCNVNIITLLMKHGADFKKVSEKGNTIIHTAVNKRNSEILWVLLEYLKSKCIDMKQMNRYLDQKTVKSGSAALHVAAQNGAEDLVKLLLLYGCSYNVVNNSNKTPRDLAANLHIASLLDQIGELFADIENHDLSCHKLKNIAPKIKNVINTRNYVTGKTLLETIEEYEMNKIAEKLKTLDV